MSNIERVLGTYGISVSAEEGRMDSLLEICAGSKSISHTMMVFENGGFPCYGPGRSQKRRL